MFFVCRRQTCGYYQIKAMEQTCFAYGKDSGLDSVAERESRIPSVIGLAVVNGPQYISSPDRIASGGRHAEEYFEGNADA
jgi:hypothetical protein